MNHEQTDVAPLRTASGAWLLFPRQIGRRVLPKTLQTRHADVKLLAVQFFSEEEKKKKEVVELNPVEQSNA